MSSTIRKVAYEQDDVFVHTAVPASTFYDNIIRGKLRIIEEGDGTFVDWHPVSDLVSDVDFEVHPFQSGDYEYGVVTTQQPCTASVQKALVQPSERKEAGDGYCIRFNVHFLHSIRRSDPRLAWSYAVFILKDGTTQPALHFHRGGIKTMVSTLQRYIWLTRSPTNLRLFVVQEKDNVLDSSFNQLELFAESPGDTISKFLNNTYYGTLSGFSKVTQYVLGSMGQHKLEERRPAKYTKIDDNVRAVDQDYEILTPDDRDIGPVIPVARGQSLQPEEWCAFIDDHGRIKDVDRLKERIFRGGIHDDIRREAWKFLLGHYTYDSSYEDRAESQKRKTKEYFVMKEQWQSLSDIQLRRFTEFANRKHSVEKDAVRTDRSHPFYQKDNCKNIKILADILVTYCMYNFDLGYVQGMSDLLSPILMLLEDEVDSFWCFAGLMELEQQSFEMAQHLMKQQLAHLSLLLKYMYPNFANYLDRHECGNLYFCFRWLLINFRREFATSNLCTLWEAMWTQNLTPHFKLFICLAILEKEKDTMMKQRFGFNEMLKHINDLANHIDVNYVLSRAESLCLQLQQTVDLPENIRELVTFLEPPTANGATPLFRSALDVRDGISALLQETEGCGSTEAEENHLEHEVADQNFAAFVDRCGTRDLVASDTSSPAVGAFPCGTRTSDEAVVELCEDTKSVF